MLKSENLSGYRCVWEWELSQTGPIQTRRIQRILITSPGMAESRSLPFSDRWDQRKRNVRTHLGMQSPICIDSDLSSHPPQPPPKSEVPTLTGRNSCVNFSDVIQYPTEKKNPPEPPSGNSCIKLLIELGSKSKFCPSKFWSPICRGLCKLNNKAINV